MKLWVQLTDIHRENELHRVWPRGSDYTIGNNTTHLGGPQTSPLPDSALPQAHVLVSRIKRSLNCWTEFHPPHTYSVSFTTTVYKRRERTKHNNNQSSRKDSRYADLVWSQARLHIRSVLCIETRNSEYIVQNTGALNADREHQRAMFLAKNVPPPVSRIDRYFPAVRRSLGAYAISY